MIMVRVRVRVGYSFHEVRSPRSTVRGVGPARASAGIRVRIRVMRGGLVLSQWLGRGLV